MIEFYNITVKDGQSLVDLAMQEYGTVDGVLWLVQDNPETLASMDDEPAAGTLLNIRFKPPVEDAKRLEYVRKGKDYTVVKQEVVVVGEGGADGTVRNSNSTYSMAVPSGLTRVFPDTPIENSAGDVIDTAPSGVARTLPDKAVKNTNGNTVDTVRAGEDALAPDSDLFDSAGNSIGQAVSGEDTTIADAHVLKSDGVSNLLDIKATDSALTTEVFDAMSSDEIVADVNAQDAAKIAEVKFALATKYTQDISFAYGSGDRKTLHIQFKGYVVMPFSNLVNIASVAVYNNGVLKSSTFATEIGDIVSITVTRSNAGLDSSLTVKGTFDDQSPSLVYSRPKGGNEQYTYVLLDNNTIDVLDNSLLNSSNVSGGAWVTNPNIGNIALSADGYQGLLYRTSTDKVMAIATNGAVSHIHPTTHAVTRVTGLSISSGLRKVYYDWRNDLLGITDTNYGHRKVLPDTPATVIKTYKRYGRDHAQYFGLMDRGRIMIAPSILLDSESDNAWTLDFQGVSGFCYAVFDSDKGRFVYGLNNGMWIVDPFTNTVVQNITHSQSQSRLLLNRNARKVYANNWYNSNTATQGFAIIDLDAFTTTNLYRVGATSSCIFSHVYNLLMRTLQTGTAMQVYDTNGSAWLPDVTLSSTAKSFDLCNELICFNSTQNYYE